MRADGPVASVQGDAALVAADGRGVCVLAHWDERLGDGAPDLEVAWENESEVALQLRQHPRELPALSSVPLSWLTPRTMCGTLAHPVAGRQLRDALTGRRIRYFDGRELATIRTVPEGFGFSGDHLIPVRFRDTNLDAIPWSRLYSAKRPSGRQYLAVTQITGTQPEGLFGGHRWPIVGEGSIGANRAYRHQRGTSLIRGRAISWSTKENSYSVEATARAPGDGNEGFEGWTGRGESSDLVPAFELLEIVVDSLQE